MVPPHIYPDGEQKVEIEKSVLDILQSFGKNLLNEQQLKNSSTKCFFDYGL